MPTRDETINTACRIFDTTLSEVGDAPEHAFLGVYAALLWYTSAGRGRRKVPHIVNGNRLQPPKRGSRPTVWVQRARDFEAYLAEHLSCSVRELPGKVDLLMSEPEFSGLQRQNSLGIAFAGLVKHTLQRFGSEHLTYEIEAPADDVYPGIAFPGRSRAPAIDVLVRKSDYPRAVISIKWSLRHDRINDITNECPVYKQAAARLRQALNFYVVTNEFDPARLGKVLDDTCIDGLTHVHRPAVTVVCGGDGRLDEMLDLTGLIDETFSW